MYSNLLFIIFFVVLVIKCVSLLDLSFVVVHYLPPNGREVWHFKKANMGHIKRAIN